MSSNRLSLLFCGCFAALLIWGHTAVVGLVNDKLAVQPATTIGYRSAEVVNGTEHATHGGPTSSPDCGNNSHTCEDFCQICDQFGRSRMDCLSVLFEHVCLSKFEIAMASLNSTDWCTWGNVSGLYSNLSLCTEEISDCIMIPWPNPLVEQTFVNIHSTFFQDCPTEELSDPPPMIVFALVITPICLIPVMVSLVVLKTKNGDGSS